MAPARSKAQPQIGSTAWISEEQENFNRFGGQEVEDFVFAARNEVDWLNEHMAEIFSSNQLNVTEIFKTPGKLRGKTPRTARKWNPLERRVPLSDVFSTTIKPNPSPLHGPSVSPALTACGVSKDIFPTPLEEPQAVVIKAVKQNTDSGYHDMTEDEMDIDNIPLTTITTESKLEEHLRVTLQVPTIKTPGTRPSEDRRTTEVSFHSAREDLISNITTKESPQRDVPAGPNMDEERREEDTEPAPTSKAQSAEVDVSTAIPGEHTEKDSLLDEDPAVDESRLSSEASSPVRPLVRKSSLSFASLPAREPLTTKKSIGARISRTSHLDQPKPNPLNRGSVLGRFTGGKSLGGTQQQVQDVESQKDGDEEIHLEGHNDEDMEMVDEERPALTREESDGDAKITKLHNKSSTQRLHEKINMLGQSQPARPTKSIAAIANVAAQLSYPELNFPLIEEIQALDQQISALPKSNTTHPTNNDDDDDWIEPPPGPSNEQKLVRTSKRYSADMMEEVSANSNSGIYESGLGHQERHEAKEPLPSTQPTVSSKPTNGLVFAKCVFAPNLISPPRATTATGKNHEMDKSTSNPILSSLTDTELSAHKSTAPAGSPSLRRHADGPLSASKSKLQSIMKTARGLFTSSAGISAQAKMETFSPRSMRSRGPAQGTLDPIHADVGLYPDLQNAGIATSLVHEVPKIPSKKGEGLRTRSSTEKEDKSREREIKKREPADSELERAREVERQKAAKYKDELDKTAGPMKIPSSGQEHAGEGTEFEAPQSQAATRKSPRRLLNGREPVLELGFMQEPAISAVQGEIAETMLAPPPRTQPHSQIQRPKDIRRPIKPAREAVSSKPKPQPVAIRVGTLSQRIPLNNAMPASSSQESLPPPQSKPAGVAKKPSNASLQTSASGTSLKSSVSSASTKPKALLAAERKKEQDEKEAQRKVDQKREMERKRAAQQEEARRQQEQQRQETERQRERERTTAAEDPWKLAQKQAIEKRRLELGKKDQQRNPQRTTNDLATGVQQDKQHVPGAPFRGELGGSRPPSRVIPDASRPPTNHPAPNAAKPPTKRVFEPENEDEPTRPTRVQGGPSYQQADAKRRRTNDEDVQEVPVRPTMAPPIRQSNIRSKDAPKHSIFSNGYPTAPSLAKASTQNHTYHPHQLHQQQQQQHHSQPPRPANPMDMAKYANGKIPFAENPNPAQPSHKTPVPSKKPAPHPAKSSPHYINPDTIDLAEIPTDSDEDSDSDADNKKQSLMASWVHSPALREQLRAQEDGVDPEAVFGPIAPLNMEEIFDKSRHHRFRSRTSSANWTGQDRLTEEEVRVDLVARERLRREGGWSYGL